MLSLSLILRTARVQSRTLATITRVGVLEHSEYVDMKEHLALKKPSALGPLDKVCSYLLGKDLAVNQTILHLNAIGFSSIQGQGTYGTGVKELKKSGNLVTGHLNVKCDEIILEQFELLVSQTKVDRAALAADLLKEVRSRLQRDFMLQRQLVGFFLVQGLAALGRQHEKRLPVEVVIRLAKLLSCGNFTKEDDTLILAWVDEHGPVKWRQLARSIGRNYPNAGVSVKTRHRLLKESTQEETKKGKIEDKDFETLIRLVLAQNPDALEDINPRNIDWVKAASDMERSRDAVYNFYMTQVHSTLRRYLTGTLDQDVRGDLIEQIMSDQWQYSMEVDFTNLAGLPQFDGHTGYSLRDLYHSMQNMTRKRKRRNVSRSEVTVEEVEEWWRCSQRKSKSGSRIRREKAIVDAYKLVISQKDENTL